MQLIILIIISVCKKTMNINGINSFRDFTMLNSYTQYVILLSFGLNIAGYWLLKSDKYASTF